MKKKKHKGCSYMKVNPLDPRKKTTIKNQVESNENQRWNNYFFKMANKLW